MQIKLGEKIRELRRRDGRKQEDLASALGVTNQAVSRWEANGGYPDMEMLPAIANYFHITIDELFGYDNDRQVKLQSYLNQADQMCNTVFEQRDPAKQVEFLRKAISEFPSEWQLQYRLANALTSMGHERQKQRKIDEGEEYFRYNTETNAQNECWKEAVSLYEEVLKKEIDDDSRTLVITFLMQLYVLTGNQESAERLALSQAPVKISREVLLAGAAEEEKADEYRGEAILALVHELCNMAGNSVMTKYSLAHSQAGLDALTAVAQLYERIFEDGNYGSYHNDMCMLYVRCSSVAVHLNDFEDALHYLEKAMDHFLGFQHFAKRKHWGSYQLTAPLVSKVKSTLKSLFALNQGTFDGIMKSLPVEYAEAIRNNPKYASIFER